MKAIIDIDMARVETVVRRLDPMGARIAAVLRKTIDQLYDGQRTGRYRWDQLYKTEQAHCGTLVAMNLQRAFRFADGSTVAFNIDGVAVDCSYSQQFGGWTISPEARNRICMLVYAEDGPTPVWSFGLVEARQSILNCGDDRVAEAIFNAAGLSSIRWLWRDAPLPPNALLQLPEEAVDRIKSVSTAAGRINQLFREAQKKIVRHTVLATVAQQDGYMKWVRADKGVRSTLLEEGILVLGQDKRQARIAASLGLPVPGPDELISVRVYPTSSRVHAAEICGRLWRKATDCDPYLEAHELPQF